jgi:hypothetical protein
MHVFNRCFSTISFISRKQGGTVSQQLEDTLSAQQHLSTAAAADKRNAEPHVRAADELRFTNNYKLTCHLRPQLKLTAVNRIQ